MEFNEEQYLSQIDPSFLDKSPQLPPLPQLKGEKIVIEELVELLKAEEKESDIFLRVVGLRFGNFGRMHSYDAGELRLKMGDYVVCDVPEKGVMLGSVAQAPFWMDNSKIRARLKKVQRKATQEDLERYKRSQELAERGREVVLQQIQRASLGMELLEIEYTLDLQKAIVYFSSESRVDFRGLLKDLTLDLKSKVELRQVGVRDEAKARGGIGPCGEELCCSKFLNRFHGVNIRMAKEQGLSLKPTRVSGMCGRLKCCLQYEVDVYKKLSKQVPNVGSKVKCSKGCGVVREVDVLRQLVTVVLEDGIVAKLDASEVLPLHGRGAHRGEELVATTDVDALLGQIHEEIDGEIPEDDPDVSPVD